ncbi:MerR family transcriptional regulator [Oceanibacterium hippocampi]|uniref:MerR family regulatory protein n=1 Tax=Oceanibacterium hippocampi TaxID=745714 RepID=A0A1Y5SPP5_9PROT|nr:MerR family transcriptional regulator [Oceanibacterium hippocampi]SLN45153.1 MerR family regulatory protein [Oceanibacterium hippocampi]
MAKLATQQGGRAAVETDSTTARRGRKSPDAFRTISEVADELDVPQHVLRFWESKFAQVKPMKRGGGRRYYRPSDIDLLRRIRDLLYKEGFTIRGVQKVLREHGAQPAADPHELANQAAAKVGGEAEGGRPAAATRAAVPLAGDQLEMLQQIMDELTSIRSYLHKETKR